ncbi:MAG TPA: hypothetical protein VKT81_07795 [Bryobacteraceae bacterium]|nr:hypothetical protein [Bryobacteraceae bacterium]
MPRWLQRAFGWLILLAGLPARAQPPIPAPIFGWHPTGDSSAAFTTIASGSMAIGPDGTLFYSENGRIRRIDSSGKVQTIVSDPQLDEFGLLAVDGSGNVFCVNSAPSGVVSRITNGALVRIAGGGNSPAADGIKATEAQISVLGLAAGPSGVYFSDSNTDKIFRVDSAGILRTVAGTGVAGTAGVGGQAVSAQLEGPSRIGFDAQGNLYIFDTGETFRLLQVNPSGTLTDLGFPAGQDVSTISIGSDGSIYYTDTGSSEMQRRRPDGSTAPVSVTSGFGFEGCGAGPFAPHTFTSPTIQVVSNSHGLLALMQPFIGRQKILQIDSAGAVTIVAGGPDEFSGDGGPASEAGIAAPLAVATDASGNVYIGDSGNHRVRKVTLDGIIQTVAGKGPAFNTQYCAAPKDGYLDRISGVAVDNDGVLFIADPGANRVWRQDLGGKRMEFAGNGQNSSHGAAIGAKAMDVPLDSLGQVVVDKAQNLWIASGSNGLVKVSQSGVILDVVPLTPISSITVDAFGTVYVTTNERAYRIAADDSLVPIASITETPTGLFGPGPPGGPQYIVGIPPYNGPVSVTTTADENETVYFITTDLIETIGSGCVRESAKYDLGAFFGDSAVHPGAGVYLADQNGNMIWRMPTAHPKGGTSIALGTASVRSLGSGLVLGNPVGFQAGDDGMGLTTYSYVSDAVAPGELVRISGTCLGPPDAVEATFNAAGELPGSLAGTQVFFEGAAAPLLSVAPGEIVAVTPYKLAGTSQTNITVRNAYGQSRAALKVVPAVPGLLHRADSAGNDTVVALNENGELNSSAHPAAVGSVVAIFGTGLGQTNPLSRDGVKRSGLLKATADVQVRINGEAAPVLFAGATPGLVGLDQINVRVPATTTGQVSVTAAGANRPSGVLWIGQ